MISAKEAREMLEKEIVKPEGEVYRILEHIEKKIIRAIEDGESEVINPMKGLKNINDLVEGKVLELLRAKGYEVGQHITKMYNQFDYDSVLKISW